MQRLSYPTETVLCYKITRNRTVLSLQRQSHKTSKTATYRLPGDRANKQERAREGGSVMCPISIYLQMNFLSCPNRGCLFGRSTDGSSDSKHQRREREREAVIPPRKEKAKTWVDEA